MFRTTVRTPHQIVTLAAIVIFLVSIARPASATPACKAVSIIGLSPATLLERVTKECAKPTKIVKNLFTDSKTTGMLVSQKEVATIGGVSIEQVFRTYSPDFVETTYLISQKIIKVEDVESNMGIVGKTYDVDFKSTDVSVEWLAPMGNDPSVYRTDYIFHGQAYNFVVAE
jgi:hypothetical protein